jgi:hypothetical protein
MVKDVLDEGISKGRVPRYVVENSPKFELSLKASAYLIRGLEKRKRVTSASVVSILGPDWPSEVEKAAYVRNKLAHQDNGPDSDAEWDKIFDYATLVGRLWLRICDTSV